MAFADALPFLLLTAFWLVHMIVSAWRTAVGQGGSRILSAAALVAGLLVLTVLLPREDDWIYLTSTIAFLAMIPLQFAASLGPGHTRRWPDWLYLAAFVLVLLPGLVLGG